MIHNMHLPRSARRRRGQPLAAWQRVLVAGALFVALLISGALIYFQPGSRSLAYPEPAISTAQPAPLPPGTDLYYYWGQHRPLDQQP